MPSSFQGRAVRRDDDECADRVECAIVDREALGGQVEHELLVGRQKHLEWRALLNLAKEIAGGAECQLHLAPGFLLEDLGDLRECKLQVGRRSHDGHVLGADRRHCVHAEQQIANRTARPSNFSFIFAASSRYGLLAISKK